MDTSTVDEICAVIFGFSDIRRRFPRISSVRRIFRRLERVSHNRHTLRLLVVISCLFSETHDYLLDLPVSTDISLFFSPLLAVESRRLNPGLLIAAKAASSCQIGITFGLS